MDFPWISHGISHGFSVPMDSHPIFRLPQDLHGTWHLRSKGHEAQRPRPAMRPVLRKNRGAGLQYILVNYSKWFILIHMYIYLSI